MIVRSHVLPMSLAMALGACQPSVDDAMARLVAGGDLASRAAAGAELALAGAAAAPAVPALRLALADPALTDVALGALLEIGPASAPALDALLRLPVDGRIIREVAVCVLLGRIGVRSAEVTAYLDARANAADPLVRAAARGALVTLR